MNVCRGQYPQILLEAWDEWDKEKKSNNHRPGEEHLSSYLVIITFLYIDYFPETQLFMLFAFENAGDTLNSFVVR